MPEQAADGPEQAADGHAHGSVAAPPQPKDEAARLAELRKLEILDTAAEQAYDDLTRLASEICGTPIALISLVDDDRQWFKSKVGLDASETPRDLAFCAHAIVEPGELFEVPDATKDERFADNPLVTADPNVRFYAGAPLTTAAGHALGTLCVIDHVAREFDDSQREALLALSRQVVAQFELRKSVQELEERVREQQLYERRLEEYQRRLEEGVAKMTQISKTDVLTELLNRRGFLDSLEEELQRAKRFDAPISLGLFDIDRFKPYNDTFGHQEGDRALRQVADLLASAIRSFDVVARFGGEEFAVIFPGTDIDGAMVVAERCRQAVEDATWDHGPITISGGIAQATPARADAESLIRDSDLALYEAKRLGRNRMEAADSVAC